MSLKANTTTITYYAIFLGTKVMGQLNLALKHLIGTKVHKNVQLKKLQKKNSARVKKNKK